MHHLDSSVGLKEEEIFQRAAELVPADRPSYLSVACAEDPAVHARMERLLRLHEDRDFMGARAERTDSSSAKSESPRWKPEQVGERIGNYKLLEQIGEGGFGIVWAAEQEKPVRRRVALKIIKLGMDTKEVIARFEQERQALAMMDHPNIARVLEAGATPLGRPFFVMELVRGIKITEYCDQANLPTEERLRLFIAVCNAVQHAHQKGIIHRDLKPSNILVTLHDGVPVPKVIDFGVAKATQQQRLTDLTVYTQFEQMIGTPLYMSPEQAEMSGLDIDTRSDIYSLGVLLYELLVGRTPFDPQELTKAGYDEMRRVIREQEPQKPSTFLSTMAVEARTTSARRRQTDSAKWIGQIRGDLDWIVMKSLEKDRTRRYETANGLAKDIERHLSSEPVQARPPTPLYRFRRMVRRNKLAFTAGTGIAAALLVGVAVSTWQAFRANAALSDLRDSAPVFAAMARSLVAKEQFDEAIEKLNIAIKLRSDLPEYLIAKADLLQSQLRFSEAASAYGNALRLNPAEPRAKAKALLCEKLAGEAASRPRLSHASLVELLSAMTREQRPAAEMMKVGKLLGEESKLLVDYWAERLSELPIPPAKPLAQRLTITESGQLALDLSGTKLADLSPLSGMPLQRLVLSGCGAVTDLSPLQGMPLRELLIGRNSGDLSPAGRQPCNVADLLALRGMKLVKLDLEGVPIADLGPLTGMALEWLSLRETNVTDLSPLQGMPLRHLDCTMLRVRDFSQLANSPLRVLSLQATPVSDLSFLRELPLETLLLNGCFEARGFQVLNEIPTLQNVMLPSGIGQVPEEELPPISALRNHPQLRRIALGGSRQEGMDAINTKTSNAGFWKEFDSDLHVRRALAKVGGSAVQFKRLKGTWQVWMNDLPISDISPLEGAPISTLDLSRTNVSDLTPLKGMQVSILYLAGTRITDLEPLRGSRIHHLCLDGCPPGIDLSPLIEAPELTELLLPPSPRNLELLRKHPSLKRISYEHDSIPMAMGHRVALTTEDVWDSTASPETFARQGKFANTEAILRRRTETSESSTPIIGLAATIILQGHQKDLHDLCKKWLGTFESNSNPFTALPFVRSCLLQADSPVPKEALESLMKRAWASGGPATGDSWFLLTEGLREFRAGHFKPARELLMHVRNDDSPAAHATALVVLSMVHHELQNRSEAQKCMVRAEATVLAHWPVETATSGAWYDWFAAHLLMQEAKKRIANSARRQGLE